VPELIQLGAALMYALKLTQLGATPHNS